MCSTPAGLLWLQERLPGYADACVVALVRELDPVHLLPRLGAVDRQRWFRRVVRERRLVRLGGVDRIGDVSCLAAVVPERGLGFVAPEQRIGALESGVLR